MDNLVELVDRAICLADHYAWFEPTEHYGNLARAAITAVFEAIATPSEEALAHGNAAMSAAWAPSAGSAIRHKIIPEIWQAILTHIRQEAGL